MPQMTRRDFVKLGAVGAGALGATPLGFDISEAMKSAVHLSSEPKRFSIALRKSSAGSGAFGARPSK